MKISVIIPTYQHAQTLPKTLESVLAQTKQPLEIIVVDDGSTDNTQAVLDPYRHRITVVTQPNQGAPTARNRGFEGSSGEAVIFWDADVIAEPTMLEDLAEALQNTPEASWSYGSFYWGRHLFKSRTFDPIALRAQNYIHTSALIRREAFPGFDPDLKRFQDWDLWLTMSEQGHTGVFVNKVLYTVIVASGRPAYSRWMPKLVYSIPWDKLPWKPRSITKHQAARLIIENKHHL